ncbi:MAG: DUF2934 domain-containing protein [Gemmataceae bacterium]
MRHHTKHPAPAKHAEPHPHPEPATDAPANGRCECVSEETVRLHAYRKWETAGHPPGDGVGFWLDAERELKHPAATA